MVIAVPHGTVTVSSEATAQLAAVTAVPPLSVTPVPPAFSAMMQADALGLTSAYAVALTDKVEAALNDLRQRQRCRRGHPTFTALFPSPQGDGDQSARPPRAATRSAPRDWRPPRSSWGVEPLAL